MANEPDRVIVLASALLDAYRFINDNLMIYASDMCHDHMVQEAVARRSIAGGTLAQTAKLCDNIRDALDTAGIPYE